MATLPRRKVLRGGLAAFAALFAPPALHGCAETRRPPGSQGTDGETGAEDVTEDAGAAAAGEDATTAGQDAVAAPEEMRLTSLLHEVGPLQAANELGMRLPEGFTARVVAKTGEEVLPGKYSWHMHPDGGACFKTDDGGWIYVSNCEMPGIGGVGALRFDAAGTLVDAYPILENTMVNCAGGPTPWGTWLSCEEVSAGRVFECDPWGEHPAVEVPSLGVFKHEAAAVDPVAGHIYLSEDEKDGCLYRYVAPGRDAERHPLLQGGRLEVAVVAGDRSVTWVEVPDPGFTGDVPTRKQVAGATVFKGGEGIWWHDGVVYLSTKHDNKIWAYDTVATTIDTIYDRSTTPDPDALYGVDNLTVTACGDVLVAEDGGEMRIVAIEPDGSLVPLMQLEGQDGSEITGPAFDPSGTRLYFSSQRGQGGFSGITYEVTGPFHKLVPVDETC
jgi:secreted PhoX family phosphatase